MPVTFLFSHLPWKMSNNNSTVFLARHNSLIVTINRRAYLPYIMAPMSYIMLSERQTYRQTYQQRQLDRHHDKHTDRRMDGQRTGRPNIPTCKFWWTLACVCVVSIHANSAILAFMYAAIIYVDFAECTFKTWNLEQNHFGYTITTWSIWTVSQKLISEPYSNLKPTFFGYFLSFSTLSIFPVTPVFCLHVFSFYVNF